MKGICLIYASLYGRRSTTGHLSDGIPQPGLIINTLKFYIGNTDKQWFDYLRESSPEDVNFWQPGGKLRFQAIPAGAPFLFKLKSPINKIAGLGFYVSHSLLPIEFAWEVFQEKNGVETLENFIEKVGSYRTA